jgi:hypothetical protein
VTGLALLMAAAALTGQSPDCEHFCMTVTPTPVSEGRIVTFTGRHWRPNRRVRISFGAYCRPDDACPDILYLAHVKTTDRGRFVLRLRAGPEQGRDEGTGLRSGSRPTFNQRARIHGKARTVSRSPRYRVLIPS